MRDFYVEPDHLYYAAALVVPTTLTAVATSLKHRGSEVTLNITRKDGTQVELEAKRVKDPDHLIGQIMQQENHAEDEGQEDEPDSS